MPAATFLLGDLLVAAESTVAAVEAPGIGESPVGRKSTGMMGALADEAGAFVSGSETPRYGIGAPPGTAGASSPEAAAKAAGGMAGASAGGTVASSPEAEVKAAGGTVASTGASAGGTVASAGASTDGTVASAGGAGASSPETAGTSSPPEAEEKAADGAGGTVASTGTSAGEAGASAGGTGTSPPEAETKAAGASSTSSTLANHRSSVSADTLEISAAEGEVAVTGAWATASEAPVTPPPYGGTKANGWALALAIPSVLNASAPPETSDGPKASLAGRGPLGVSTVPASGATPDCSGDGPQPMAGDTEGAVDSGIAAVSTPPQIAVGLSDDTVSPLATATSSAPGTGAAVSGKGASGATWPTGMTGRPSPATKKSSPVGAPHAVQKLSSGPSCVPHLRQNLYSDMLEHSLLSALRPQLHSTIA